MAWYFWVFGSVAVLNMLAVGTIGVLAYLDYRYSRRQRNLEDEVRLLGAKLAVREETIRKLNVQLREVSQGNNSFGRISP